MRSQKQSPIAAFDPPSNPWPFCVRVFIFCFLDYRQDIRKGESNLNGFASFLGTHLDLAFVSPYGALSPKLKMNDCSDMKNRQRMLQNAYNVFAYMLFVGNFVNPGPI